MKNYDHSKIEKKWQKAWDAKKVYKTENPSKKKKFYVLDMFPYPSGAGLHVGHPRGYIGSDVYARMKRMQGYNVLHPMGYDAFGLPAEQYAIEHKIHPRKAVEKNIKTFRGQLDKIGFSYDWSRQVNTTDPEYYKWTQWIFLQIYNSYYDTEKNKARPISELIKKFEKTDKNWKKLSEIEKEKILMQYRLAYEGYSEVNWCPKLGTVLANDEIVDDKDGNPVSERGGYPVEKKSMRQWFMRITSYADRLLTDLDGLDWSGHIKEIQKNWIGKSDGSEIEFKTSINRNIQVFTTRADTLFGVTYVVLSPEHQNIGEFLVQAKNMAEVSEYIREAKERAKKEDITIEKEKTGVELKGIKAINPVNGEEVPVWVADYVLASYGTGAVMAVPAHDERDFEFAKKYNLPMKYVVAPKIIDEKNPPKNGFEYVVRNAAQAVVYNPIKDEYLTLRWKKFDWHSIVLGGIEGNESVVEAAKREVIEETGYSDLIFKKILGSPVISVFHAPHKGINRVSVSTGVLFELASEKQVGLDRAEHEQFDVEWVSSETFFSKPMTNIELPFWRERMKGKIWKPFIEYGTIINSNEFNQLTSEEARKKITEFVGGKMVTKYKMRDAIFARQRYWGEPIPLKHDKAGAISMLKEKNLPLKLPNVTSYEPTGTGESPLSGVKAWTKEGYETNTMPGWAGSSWYFLRYMDPKNKKAFADKKALKYWKDVDMYVGGSEHATGHLLYSRFWHKFLFDMGHVPTPEPFKTLKNQGMILASDGRKMSKRWGNVINPDDIVKTYGADTLRVYEMFMGPFEASQPWNTESIIGSRRFIEKVWKVASRINDFKSPRSSSQARPDFKNHQYVSLVKTLHKTIKKVNDDIANFAFNTAISSMMVLVNEMDKVENISKEDFKTFLQILAPFAPHVAEELWYDLGEKKSIHLAPWPKYNMKLLIEDTLKIAVQVNGKVRGEIEIPTDADQEVVFAEALVNENVKKWTDGQEIKKKIYVKGRLVNFVV
ncbi:MAG: class I tRNA ligase family protein [Patescibacteria group bacterium]